MTKTLREQYFANEILRIGDIVEDTSGQSLKIIDRGSNYVTVQSESGVQKKWLDDIITESKKEIVKEPDFMVSESGQIKMFGYETKSFPEYLSEFIVEQFTEFDDMYSKHQIVKLLDMAMIEENVDRKYELLEKVSGFYKTHSIEEPILIEGIKNELERKRIAGIFAYVAGVENDKSPYQTIVNAVDVLRKKYKEPKQWEVLWPFFKVVQNSGITGILQKLPYNFDRKDVKTNPEKYDPTLESVTELLEDNFDELYESFELEDVLETFSADEYDEEFLSEEQLNEVLSLAARTKLGREMRSHEAQLTVKRARSLTRAASSSVLLARARRMAETMIKRRIFRKAPADLTRQEKERFEAGAQRRKALVAKLAQRLVTKVRMMQTNRMHNIHAANPGKQSHTHISGAD